MGTNVREKRLRLLGVAGVAVLVAMALVSASPAAVKHRATSTPAPTNTQYPWLPYGDTPAGNDWPMAGGDGAGTSYSSLTQITTANVSKLKVAWQLSPLNEAGGQFYRPENQPIVLTMGNGVTNLPEKTTMYMQVNYGLVALDPATGNILWQYKGATSKVGAANPALAAGIAAHSFSYGDGMIFAGQQDGSLVALDAKTGAPVWTSDVEAAGTAADGGNFEESNPWSIFDAASSTNKLSQDMVFSAPNGGESPLRGHLDAYNAKTGALVWRTWSTPDPTQLPFILTWGNPAEPATGGAAAWSLPTVDNTLRRVYYGTGNHYPEFNSSPGKKLWTDTLMSVDLTTGALKWYFQTVHHDEWDYDVSNPPLRVNPVINGKRVAVVTVGGKNGYLYVLNARNGGVVPNFSIPETKVDDISSGAGLTLNNSWPTQPEPTGGAGQILPHCMTAAVGATIIPGYPTAPNGTPIVPTCQYTPSTQSQYNLMYPAQSGGINWNRQAYSPITNDLYICADVSAEGWEDTSATNGTLRTVGTINGSDGGTITALNMSTNKIDWQVKIPAAYQTAGGADTTEGACYSGDMVTAGGVLFVAENPIAFGDGTPTPVSALFLAINAKTGKQLWSYTNNEGGGIKAQATTFMAGGKQYVSIMMDQPATSAQVPDDHLTTFVLGS